MQQIQKWCRSEVKPYAELLTLNWHLHEPQFSKRSEKCNTNIAERENRKFVIEDVYFGSDVGPRKLSSWMQSCLHSAAGMRSIYPAAFQLTARLQSPGVHLRQVAQLAAQLAKTRFERRRT